MTREVIRDADGTVLAATCVDQPLTDEARGHLAELARAGRRLMAERDPLGLLADKQRLSIDRVWKRETPMCTETYPGRPDQVCGRPEGHQMPHLRHVPDGVDAWQPLIDDEAVDGAAC